MAEFEDKLNSILSNPDAMAQIMQMAQSFSAQSSAQPPSPPPPAAPPGGMDPGMMMKLLPPCAGAWRRAGFQCAAAASRPVSLSASGAAG